ncbi:DNA-directed RNA polymerase subunit alpha C-terminal domain-containing protein [Janthinobacterium sp. LB2P10]|uniref:DNA-directed RNA polymerase subunit alpha C-terminal domain-containing protein n=1 Tax=Janthinobacterium sp. LB2P10 TaxID=3424194 RepID=UPI003F24BED3
MPSDVGRIPADGGEYLHFLLAVRQIVEPVTPINERVAELRAELTKPRWQDFVTRLEDNVGCIVNHLFPPAISTIPGLPEASRGALKAEGINTAAKIAAMTDADLLAIKGIGKAKLKAIRDWEATIQDRDAVRLENICR